MRSPFFYFGMSALRRTDVVSCAEVIVQNSYMRRTTYEMRTSERLFLKSYLSIHVFLLHFYTSGNEGDDPDVGTIIKR
jgi:hypothetical protein